MHPEHKKLMKEVRRVAGTGSVGHHGSKSYLGSVHRFYNVSVPERRKIVKKWMSAHTEISPRDFFAILDSLYKGDSHEEKTIASILLGLSPKMRISVKVTDIDRWLSYVSGWAEVDHLCQSIFTAEELLSRWSVWKTFMKRLSKDKNIHKRRASLVLLTGPVCHNSDIRLRDLAFEIIDTLKPEKEILVTKAISWLLRSMIAFHRKEVTAYLSKNALTLPKIALRETRRKLETGLKF